MNVSTLQPYLEQARGRLQEQAGRVTSARVRVFALLLQAGRPLTHHEVLADLATDTHPLDRVTAYRVLDWLVAQGWAIRQAGDDRVFRFALARPVDPAQSEAPRSHARHSHFRCIRCHCTYCLDDWPTQAHLGSSEFMRLPAGFVGEQVELTVYGVCPQCSA